MSAFLQQEYDFISRTKTILSQYDSFFDGKDKNEKYEVTLLINCFIGLLVIPQQHWFDYLPEEEIVGNSWGINTNNVTYIRSGELKSVKEISRHLRNSVTHYRFRAFNDSKNEISHVKFLDYTDHTENVKTFEATISIANLKIFLTKFSSRMVDEMNRQK
jgi:hypothetical protein